MEKLQVPSMFTFVRHEMAEEIIRMQKNPEEYPTDLVVKAGRIGSAIMARFGIISEDTPPRTMLGPVGFCFGPDYPNLIPLQIRPSCGPNPFDGLYVQEEGWSPMEELLQQRRRVTAVNGNGRHHKRQVPENPEERNAPVKWALSEYLALSSHARMRKFPAPLVVVERNLELSEIKVVHYRQSTTGGT